MNFKDIKTTNDVANFLGYDLKKLNFIAYKLSDEKKYKEIVIKKRNGKDRTLSVPNDTIKSIQRKLKDGIESIYKSKGNVHGFVKDRSIVTNARCHVNKKYLLNCDIRDFFPSINFGRVRGIFTHYFKFNNDVSTLLTNLVCYNNQLPQGSPCSPILSNVICGSMDKKLYNYAKLCGCQYTRYCDDMSFSADTKKAQGKIWTIVDDEYKISLKLKEIIHESGFEVNDDKTFFNKQNKRQQVTGLVVNEKVNFQRKYIDAIRSALYHCQKDGVYNAALNYNEKYAKKKLKVTDNENNVIGWYSKVLKGKLTFVKYICPKISLIKYCERYNEIFLGINYISYEECESSFDLKRKVILLQNEKDENIGSAFFITGVGLLTCEHVVKEGTVYHYYDVIARKNTYLNNEDLIFDENLDIAVFKINDAVGYEIKPHQRYQLNKEIKTIAYPNADKEVLLETGNILSKGICFEQECYMVSTRIVWGMSGGVVLDKNNFVVGMCRYGDNPNQVNAEDINYKIIPGRVIYKFILDKCLK